ncbi:MAG: hypothetical protein OMM_06606 [Candidatus Magnetoglobus multicellularis str. Araruama]|uniref:Cyanophage baseplate Pam3 plug gp18 domain-containing protein n=1 Tax=Candidatus Magnetoglobus multicellularis str. Araruama TaxID=890399 RepID=A0A1V1PGQ8_9BACT|nr:MAG: hypothetical protein OMM_06606 [Candidatus Magnetoglobus multicellularis str. Araruama]
MKYLSLSDNPEYYFDVIIFDLKYSIRTVKRGQDFLMDIYDSELNPLIKGILILPGVFLLNNYGSIPFNLYTDDIKDPFSQTKLQVTKK